MTGLHRIGVKVFCEKCDVELSELIPIFHRWIQRKRLPQMLIDVADYSHVPAGPGILLVADEGNYTLDDARQLRGLTYFRKRPLPSDGLLESVCAVAKYAVTAALALEDEPELAGRLVFDGSELSVLFNDRLNAPNTDAAFGGMESDLTRFFDLALGAEHSILSRSTDVRERLTLGAHSKRPLALRDLAARLAE